MPEQVVDVRERLPSHDHDRWDRLNPAQRAKAAERASAFDAWHGGTVNLADAIEIAKLSRSRFYSLAAEWRSGPSLEALGVLTGQGGTKRRFEPESINTLQSAVVDVVRWNAGSSVSRIVRDLVVASGIEPARQPGVAKLREIVETELRRVAATHEVGHAVQLDCCAINLAQPNRRPYIMFACLDVGTGLLLGAAVTTTADALVGYPMAACDALARIDRDLQAVPWAARLSRAEITAGDNLDSATALVQRVLSGGVRSNIQLARAPRRYGRYIRQRVGMRFGRVQITPTRTEAGEAIPDNGDFRPWSGADASAAVAIAADDHNANILARLGRGGRTLAPGDLTRFLQLVSAGR